MTFYEILIKLCCLNTIYVKKIHKSQMLHYTRKGKTGLTFKISI